MLFGDSKFLFCLSAVAREQWLPGVARLCGYVMQRECVNVTGICDAWLGITNATGTVCYCTGDLCNSANIPRAVAAGNSSLRTSSTPEDIADGALDGRMVIGVTASLSLLALAAARFLNG